MDIEAFGDVGADGAEDAFGFEGLAALDDAGERFVAFDDEGFLGDDRAFVEIGGDEVGGDADDFDATLVGLAIGVRAGEGGQERGVDVDDFVFPAPDEIGREDFHEAGEHDEIDFMLFEEREDLFLGLGAVEKRNVIKGKLAAARDGSEVGSIADDDDGLCAEARGRLGEEAFEHVGFLRDENGESLRADRDEMNLRFHLEVTASGLDFALDGGAVKVGGRPGGLEGHAELAAGDLFLHGFDVGAQLKEELRDPRDDAGFVVSNEGDRGEMLGHETDYRKKAWVARENYCRREDRRICAFGLERLCWQAMKALFRRVIVFLVLSGGSFLLQAQTNNAARENAMISFLTPAEQKEYAVARAKALADNPGLKSEGENLLKQGASVMASGTAEDKSGFMEAMRVHRDKLRAAMLHEDPTLEPLFALIDKHIAEMKARSLSQAQSSSGATNAPPVSSSPSP